MTKEQRVFIIKYNSQGNAFSGEIAFIAESLVEAQDQFLNWLKSRAVYQHLWNLTFSVEEVKLADQNNPMQ